MINQYKILRKITSVLLTFAIFLGPVPTGFADDSLGVPSSFSQDQTGTRGSDIAQGLKPGSIGNGFPLLNFIKATDETDLPPRISLSDNTQTTSTVNNIRTAIRLAIDLHLENGLKVSASYHDRSRQTLVNLIELDQYLDKRLYLFNAIVEGPEDYLLGFRFKDKIGLSVEFIDALYAISPKRLAQYIYHECAPETYDKDREDHRIIYNQLQMPIFGEDEVIALKENLRDFITACVEKLGDAGRIKADQSVGQLIPIIPISQAEATKRLGALPTIGTTKNLRAFYKWVRSQTGITHTEVLTKLEPELKEMEKILRAARPKDELSALLEKGLGIQDRQLDILRGMSELMLQFIDEKPGEDNAAKLSGIKKIFAESPDIAKLLINYFEAKFDPDMSNAARERKTYEIRADMGSKIKDLEDDKYYLMQLALTICIATIRTDYYVQDRTELFFRMNPRALLPYDHKGIFKHTLPFGLIWIHVPYGAYGVHSRYTDVARGGLRRMVSDRDELRSEVVTEGIALSFTQDDKHSKIPEGGSKGAYIYEEGLNEIAAGVAYVSGLINCMKRHPDIVTAAGFVEEVDPLELGPDEGTSDLTTLVSARAHQMGLKDWRLLISGKLGIFGGTAHMSNNLLVPAREGNRVTSLGVWRHAFQLIRYLREIGKIKSAEGAPIAFSITGNMTGDVASGLAEIAIHNYGKNARILTMSGSSVVAFNPGGFDNDELLKLYDKEASIANYPAEKMRPGGFIFNVKKGKTDDCYITLDEQTTQYMNTRALDPKILTDLRVHMKRYLLEAGVLSVKDLVKSERRDSAGKLIGVTVHGAYLREIIFFLVRSDILLTGGGRKDSINDNNWQLFFDYDGNPTAPAICHGANVIVTSGANNELEDRGVVIEPDEKANSVGVEISSRMEIDFNSIFTLDEVVPGLMKSYFGQVLTKCLRDADDTYWVLRLEAYKNPKKHVVTTLAPQMSADIKSAANMIMGSNLVSDKKEGYSPAVIKILKDYFPDVAALDNKYPGATLDRVFGEMSSKRIQAIAAKRLAYEVVTKLGIGYLQKLADETGLEKSEIIKVFLELSQELNISGKQQEVFDNKAGLLPIAQLELLNGIRSDLRGALNARLAMSMPKKESSQAALSEKEIKYRSEVFKNNLISYCSEHPEMTIAIVTDTDLGGKEQASMLAVIHKAVTEVRDMLPNLKILDIRGSGSESESKGLKSRIREAVDGGLEIKNIFMVTNLKNSDSPEFGSLKGRAWITALDDKDSGQYIYLPVFESITLNIMAARGADIISIKRFYDSISDQPKSAEELDKMIRERIFYILPRIVRISYEQLRKTYEAVCELYLSA